MASKRHEAAGICWCGQEHDPRDRDVVLEDPTPAPGFDVFRHTRVGRVEVGQGRLEPVAAALAVIAEDVGTGNQEQVSYSLVFPPDFISEGAMKMEVDLRFTAQD